LNPSRITTQAHFRHPTESGYTITTALKSGDDVRLVGFGSFSVSARPAREGKNPRTGEKLTIAASKAPKFSAGKGLKDTVNGI